MRGRPSKPQQSTGQQGRHTDSSAPSDRHGRCPAQQLGAAGLGPEGKVDDSGILQLPEWGRPARPGPVPGEVHRAPGLVPPWGVRTGCRQASVHSRAQHPAAHYRISKVCCRLLFWNGIRRKRPSGEIWRMGCNKRNRKSEVLESSFEQRYVSSETYNKVNKEKPHVTLDTTISSAKGTNLILNLNLFAKA